MFHRRISCQLDAHSSLIAAALAVLLIATAPEEFGVPECTTTLEAAGLCGPHRWGIILPNSSRVSMLTYQAIVAVRYPELVLHEPNHVYIGHFVPHESTVAQGGFRTVLWNAPKDLRAAVEDVVAFCTYLKNYHHNLTCSKERPRSCLSYVTVLRCTTCSSNMAFILRGMVGCEFPPLPLPRGQQHALRSLFKQAVGFSVEDAEMQQQTSVKTAMEEQL